MEAVKPEAKAESPKPAAAAPAVAPADKPAAKANAEFQKVLDGAKAEGAITVWLSVPKLDDTKKALFSAFEKRFNLKVSWEWLNLNEVDSLDKFLVESKAGRKPADLISTIASVLTGWRTRDFSRHMTGRASSGASFRGLGNGPSRWKAWRARRSDSGT